MRILVFGAGVIGSLYAQLFHEAGQDVTILARTRRYRQLKEKGLQYERDGKIHTSAIQVIDHLAQEDIYSFIFVAVRENQLHEALETLRTNQSPTIVTMVNSLEEYDAWEEICGKGRILPAFPGAGGSLEQGVLHADLTPRWIQPTTFGEKDGVRTERSQVLARLFQQAWIPYQIVPDMHGWQLCHLALVVPLADSYYETKEPLNAGKDRLLMHRTALQIRKNLLCLKEAGYPLSPKKLNLLCYMPVGIFERGLAWIYQSSFGHTFMYAHAMKAPDEMHRLHNEFYAYIDKKKENGQ